LRRSNAPNPRSRLTAAKGARVPAKPKLQPGGAAPLLGASLAPPAGAAGDAPAPLLAPALELTLPPLLTAVPPLLTAVPPPLLLLMPPEPLPTQ